MAFPRHLFAEDNAHVQHKFLPERSVTMCVKLYVEFWTPTNFKDPSLETRVKEGRLRSDENVFAGMGRVEYYECHADPSQILYFNQPWCKPAGDAGQQAHIRDFCPNDDTCAIRIVHFAKHFDAAVSQYQNFRRIQQPRNREAHERDLAEYRKWAELKLSEWKQVYDAHKMCPGKRMADPMLIALLSCNAMNPPIEFPTARRLGDNPYNERIP